MTDNGQDHGAALLEWFINRPQMYTADAEKLANNLIAERDQARNEVMALRVAKEQAEAALETEVARAEKAEADLEFAHNAKDHWTKKAYENLARAERAEAERDVAVARAEKAEAEAATWKERAERARGELLARFCKADNCPPGLRSEDSPYICDGCPVGATLADNPPKEPSE